MSRFVCSIASRENAGDPNLGILKSAWTDYPSSKAVDDYLIGLFFSAGCLLCGWGTGN